MADQCNQPPKDGWKGPVKPHLFAAEVQEEGQEQPMTWKIQWKTPMKKW